MLVATLLVEKKLTLGHLRINWTICSFLKTESDRLTWGAFLLAYYEHQLELPIGEVLAQKFLLPRQPREMLTLLSR